MSKGPSMKRRQLRNYFKKNPCLDLNGKWVAYDVDGKPLGEVVYKKGIIISRRTYKKK